MGYNSNQKRLVGLIRLFDVPVQSVASITGKSRPYVSRIINGDGKLGTEAFFRNLEEKLPTIVAARQKAFFEFSGADVTALGDVV